MKAFAAVFAREIREHKIVFPVALAAGLMMLVFSVAFGWSKPNAADVRILGALIIAAAFAMTFGVVFGGSVIAGETAGKRMPFYFSRPLSPGAIWGGKLAAAFVLTAGPTLLALLPALVAGGPTDLANVAPAGIGAGEYLTLLLGLCFLLVVFTHTGVTLARLRSPWIAFDATLAMLAGVVIFFATGALLRNGVIRPNSLAASAPVRAFLFLLGGAMLAAAYVQVAEGRTDARRAHGAFSVTLWGIVGTLVITFAAFAGWVAAARATDIEHLYGGTLLAPRGSWVVAGGPLRGRAGAAGAFLFDTAAGRSLRIRSGDAVFSQDGTRAAWAEERFGFFEKEKMAEVGIADLGAGKIIETGVKCSGSCRVALSPTGHRAAILSARTLSAYDVSNPGNPKQLAAVRIEGESRMVVFLDEDTLRFFPGWVRLGPGPTPKGMEPADLEITELSLPSKKSFVTGRFENRTPLLRLSPEGRYFFGSDDKRLTLHDGRTGALVATLSEDLEDPKLRFFSGNRFVVAGIGDGKGVLKIFLEGERTPSRSIDLGAAAGVILGSEIAPGRVAVALNPFRSNDERSRKAWTLAIVDVPSQKVVSSFEGLVPADRFSWWSSPVLAPAEAGSPASKLFLDAEQRLVRLDPATGARTVLLGRSK